LNLAAPLGLVIAQFLHPQSHGEEV
jgi:hypothetical protein